MEDPAAGRRLSLEARRLGERSSSDSSGPRWGHLAFTNIKKGGNICFIIYKYEEKNSH